jgi:hypothetical protein
VFVPVAVVGDIVRYEVETNENLSTGGQGKIKDFRKDQSKNTRSKT